MLNDKAASGPPVFRRERDFIFACKNKVKLL